MGGITPSPLFMCLRISPCRSLAASFITLPDSSCPGSSPWWRRRRRSSCTRTSPCQLALRPPTPRNRGENLLILGEAFIQFIRWSAQKMVLKLKLPTRIYNYRRKAQPCIHRYLKKKNNAKSIGKVTARLIRQF